MRALNFVAVVERYERSFGRCVPIGATRAKSRISRFMDCSFLIDCLFVGRLVD